MEIRQLQFSCMKTFNLKGESSDDCVNIFHDVIFSLEAVYYCKK